MSSIRNITSSTPMPPDLAKKIGVSGVNEIMGVFWKGYRELKVMHLSLSMHLQRKMILLKSGMKKLLVSGIQETGPHQLLLMDFALCTNMQIIQ